MEILSMGEKIKRKRKELNMTLKDLAGSRITPGQISLVESGKSNPSMDLLEYLANALNTTVEYLMESEETQAEKICLFYQNIAEAQILNSDLLQAEQNIDKSIYYCEKYKLEYQGARNLSLRGDIYMEHQDIASAQQIFLSANIIFIKNNSYEEIIETLLKLGKITLKMMGYQSASSYFKQAEKVFIDNQMGNDFLLGEIYYYIGYTYFKLENIENAIKYSYLAKEKFNQIDSKNEYANSLLLLADGYNKKGDIKNAIKYSKVTLKVFKEINNLTYVSEIENNLGRLFYEFENMEESFIHLNKAKEIRQNTKDLKLIDTLVNICENYIKLKSVSKAKEALSHILDYIENGNNKALFRYYLLKYRVDLLEDNKNEAENTLLQALMFVKEQDKLKEAAEVSIMIGKFYVDGGRSIEAAKYLNEGVELFKRLGVIK
ncbi:helix-turn-helix domain-containing protein [Clostridium estertheticum]|uniref:Transcriptional regulator n=1 Tax=Clostridium estertheticum subsp. estertheticum TaxID=1552 RepID=A0A1J0GLW3_9CLOT|nr:helix-turn-helix transcriptional regulator [Clostridium estertheticum]APC41878.1 transcriptional regulator [Clostridium estertheticum subsp. estertheticum]MBU3073273.1 helix-turn-helix domain-containing protein [Clostridium estertheticum]MBU3163486.1 helix-turn-helix domain-containing protein [Clostridium estertheticum]MBU3173223.1 helix-turn-helix domain-containing protein [Clostridium estertheticum]MBX4261037.1 helix-turn-helix domain-containing protein [Clostridium estertheticum]